MSGERGSILVGMSGGVDSSATAMLLARQGWQVRGVYFDFGLAPRSDGPGATRPVDDARAVADRLGIELHVADMAGRLGELTEYFVAEYRAGRTPNPCIRCNRRVKFAGLVAEADRLGVDAVATGHYARVIRAGGHVRLHRANCRTKDQSYALFMLDPAQLARLHLPLGELEGKDAVRALAAQAGLDVHDKPDSQEICFVPGDDYVAYLRKHGPAALQPGEIVDQAGRVVGRHDGHGAFTIGQRRGLGVAMGVPMYVTAIDPATARVTIGPAEALMGTGLRASGASWLADDVPETFDATVQIRYNHAGQAGRVRRTEADSFTVEFTEPAHAVTPGQAAVVYREDQVLGGGWIDGAQR